MTDERVADLVRQAWSGEVLGVALFERLVDADDDEGHRVVLQGARDHEAATLEHARRLADDLGVDVGDGATDRETGRRFGDALAALPWDQRVTAIVDGTKHYRELYAELAAVCDHPAVAELVAHEPALRDLLRA